MRAIVTLLSLTPALLAQQAPDPLRYVPADAAFVVRTKGLAGWRADLGATGIGKALAAPGTAASWTALVDGCKKELDPDGEHEKQWGELAELLLGHSGTIVLAGRFDFSQMTGKQPPGFCLSLAATGDDHTDLARLAKVIEGLLPDGAVDRELAGQQVRVHEAPGGQCTAPFLHEGTLVMLWSSDLEKQAAPCLDKRDNAFPLAPQLQGTVFGLQIEAHEAVRSFLDALAKLPDGAKFHEDDAAQIAKALELSGVRAVQRFVATAFADGKHLGQEMRLEFTATARGLFDAIMPVRRTNPRLLTFLPASAQNWGIGIFDMEAALNLYGMVFEQFGGELPLSREEIEGKFTEFTKLRLHEDVLSLLGGEYMRIDDYAFDLDADVDERLERIDENYGNSCFVVQLRDAKSMAQNLEKALRARGLHAGRKTEEYADTKIYTLRLLGTMPIEYAFAADVVVVGIGGGETTRQNLRSVLDTVAARTKGAAATELSAAVQARLQGWPEDWAAIEVGDLGEILDGMITSFEGLAAMLPEDEQELDIGQHLVEFARKLRTELVRHDAAAALSASYSARDAYVIRSRW